jgi:hypothetical protein
MYALRQILLEWSNQEDDMGDVCNTIRIGKCIQIFSRKTWSEETTW